jgi:hypothetical protein
VSAEVKLIPRPPARVERRKAKMESLGGRVREEKGGEKGVEGGRERNEEEKKRRRTEGKGGRRGGGGEDGGSARGYTYSVWKASTISWRSSNLKEPSKRTYLKDFALKKS